MNPSTISEFLSREESVRLRADMLSLVVRDMLHRGKTVDDVSAWVTKYIEEMISVGLKLQAVAARIDEIDQASAPFDPSDGTVLADPRILQRDIGLMDDLAKTLMRQFFAIDSGIDTKERWSCVAVECIRQMEWAKNCALSVGEQRLAAELKLDPEKHTTPALDCKLTAAPDGWEP